MHDPVGNEEEKGEEKGAVVSLPFFFMFNLRQVGFLSLPNKKI